MTEPAWSRNVKTTATLVFLGIVGFLLWVLVFVLVSEISVLAQQIATWVTILAVVAGLAALGRFLVRRSRARRRPVGEPAS